MRDIESGFSPETAEDELFNSFMILHKVRFFGHCSYQVAEQSHEPVRQKLLNFVKDTHYKRQAAKQEQPVAKKRREESPVKRKDEAADAEREELRAANRRRSDALEAGFRAQVSNQ